MGFARLPDARRYRLTNATVPACLAEGADLAPDRDGLALADLTIDGGTLAAIRPAGSPDRRGPAGAGPRPRHGLAGLRRGAHPSRQGPYLAARAEPGRQLRRGALHRSRGPGGHWSAADVRARMAFGLRCAFAHGTRLIRTHIDSDPPQHRISWPVFAELRAEWAGRIELQGSALVGIDRLLDDAVFRRSRAARCAPMAASSAPSPTRCRGWRPGSTGCSAMPSSTASTSTSMPTRPATRRCGRWR